MKMLCGDFLEFQECLKKSRDVDDKLIYTLNVSLPTTSFRSDVNLTSRCKDLYDKNCNRRKLKKILDEHSRQFLNELRNARMQKLENNFKLREASIENCINEATNNIQHLRSQPSDNTNVTKNLKKEQTKVRLLRTELGVEEVLKDRSLKLLYEKCHSFYKPKNLSQ